MITIKRKIVQHGNTSLTVSLPIKWAKKYDLKKGDEIDVEEKNNAIVISTDKGFVLDSQEVEAKKLDDKTLNWLLSALYKRGHDEIRVYFDDPDHMQIIQQRVNQLLGYAIIEQTHDSCVIKNISEALEGEFDATLKRAFLLTISMGDGILEVVASDNHLSKLKGLLSMEETNNQLTGFCHRILNKKGYKEFNKSSFVYTIIWLLESIADEYRDICKLLMDQDDKGNIQKETIELFKDTNDLVRKLYDVYYDFSHEKILDLAETKRGLRARANECMMGKNDILLVKYLDSVAQRVSDSIGSLLGLYG